MATNKQRRRERARTKPTIAEHADLGPPGHADPARHIERLNQLVDDDFDGPQVYYTYVDVDLDRRLRRRGWRPFGDVVGEGWFYAPSTPDRVGEAGLKVSPQDAAAEKAALDARRAWAHRALDRRHNIDTDDGMAAAIADLGPMPPMAGARVEWVEPTAIQVEADGYKVMPAGFPDQTEDWMITDRHELWNTLPEIEAIRHRGPCSRIRQFDAVH